MLAPVTNDDELLTLPAAARELQISHVTLYRLVKAGRIPCIQTGQYRLIKRSDLEAFKAIKRDPGRPRTRPAP